MFTARFFLAIGLAAILGCATLKTSTEAGPQWVSDMHRLSAAHLQLMPIVADGKRFSDPANHALIEAELKQMAEVAGSLVKDTDGPKADPLIEFSASRFAMEVRQANQAFKMNDLQWSRYALNRASGYCISCHTRANRGQYDFQISWKPELQNLTGAQKVEYFLANRLYSSALTEAKKMASSTDLAQLDPRAWSNALDRVMAMLVRVKNDPAEAAQLAKLIYTNTSAPYYARSDARLWLKDIEEWTKESKVKGGDVFKNSVKLAQKAERYTPGSKRAGLILNLRASQGLHQVLEDPKSSRYAEGLFYAGLVSKNLGEVNQGFLDQYYFESCIRRSPHSDLAERCFVQFEGSVRETNPFMDLEPESEWAVSSRLAELRKLARAKETFHEPAWEKLFWEMGH